jgi:hypothetical protein
MESRAAWMLMAALAELARRRPASGDPDDRGQYGFSDFAPDEVAAELRLSHQSAASQMIYAVAVEERLPRSFAALAAGQIHPVHLRIIDDETRILSPELAAAADEILAEKAESATFGELRYAAHRLVLKLDPDAARKRKEAAAKHEAEVRRFRESSGNAGMIARELPPAEVLASSLDHLADGDWIEAGNKPVAACAGLGNYCDASDQCHWCTRGAGGHRHGFHDPFGEVHCQFCGSGGCPGRA